MEVLAEKIETPLGVINAPLSPNFKNELAKCQTKEDLFKMVEASSWGHINPDAWNEVEKRGLAAEYKEWSNSQSPFHHEQSK